MNTVELQSLLAKAESRLEKGDFFSKTDPVSIPLLDGSHLPIIFEPESIAKELRVPLLQAFLRLSSTDKSELTRHLYAAFRDFAEIIRDDGYYNSIQDVFEENFKRWGDPVPVLPTVPNQIWALLKGLDVSVHTRSGYNFVKLRFECQWDTEHGIAVWYENGNRLRQVAGWDTSFEHLLDRPDQVHPVLGDRIYGAHFEEFRTYERIK